MAKEEKTKEEIAEVIEIPTQTAPAIKIGEEVISPYEIQVRIYNLLKKIEKAVA